MAVLRDREDWSGDFFPCDGDRPNDESGDPHTAAIEEETAFLEQLKLGNKEKARQALGILLDKLFDELSLSAIVPRLFELLALSFRVAVHAADFKKAATLKIKLAKELRQVDAHEKAVAWAEQMMLLFIDLISQENGTSASQKIIQRANAYIVANYHRDISLGEIAGHVHLSPSYFSRLYKQVTKGNLIDFINSVRIDHAKKLLITTSHDIDYIAFAVGFNTHNYFTTVFRRMEEMTPSEYRVTKTHSLLTSCDQKL